MGVKVNKHYNDLLWYLLKKLKHKRKTFIKPDHITQYLNGRKLWNIIKSIFRRVSK